MSKVEPSTALWDDVRDERLDLADVLESFTPDQWNAKTLCTDWRVRDVIAHMIWTIEGFKLLPAALGVVANGGNADRYMSKLAVREGGRDTRELLSNFRSLASNRRHPPFLGVEDMLLDIVVHQQDIRRPLGIPYSTKDERLRAVADKFKDHGRPFFTRKLIEGLHLVATDSDWTTGEGPEVRGPLASLVMAMGRRATVLDDLEGDGKGLLASRL
jgi:uncharacterized protein (TIGR03083 family)